jgi:predicted amidophosphoribosyltransferase
MKEIIAICSKCGFVSATKKEKYCPNCGLELLKKCPNCKEPIDHPMAQYCPVCGVMYAQPKTLS